MACCRVVDVLAVMRSFSPLLCMMHCLPIKTTASVYPIKTATRDGYHLPACMHLHAVPAFLALSLARLARRNNDGPLRVKAAYASPVR
ncbi:hypothetical protein J3E69DRAFT_346982 [Trichoderma sp. SZMC 28015]